MPPLSTLRAQHHAPARTGRSDEGIHVKVFKTPERYRWYHRAEWHHEGHVLIQRRFSGWFTRAVTKSCKHSVQESRMVGRVHHRRVSKPSREGCPSDRRGGCDGRHVGRPDVRDARLAGWTGRRHGGPARRDRIQHRHQILSHRAQAPSIDDWQRGRTTFGSEDANASPPPASARRSNAGAGGGTRQDATAPKSGRSKSRGHSPGRGRRPSSAWHVLVERRQR